MLALVEGNALADGILGSPAAPCHGLIDDRHQQGFQIVVIREASALQQGLPDGLKIVGADASHVYQRRELSFGNRPAFDLEIGVTGSSGEAAGIERKVRRQGGGLHTANGLHAQQDVVPQGLELLGLRIARKIRTYAQGQEMIRAEARSLLQQLQEAADHE